MSMLCQAVPTSSVGFSIRCVQQLRLAYHYVLPPPTRHTFYLLTLSEFLIKSQVFGSKRVAINIVGQSEIPARLLPGWGSDALYIMMLAPRMKHDSIIGARLCHFRRCSIFLLHFPDVEDKIIKSSSDEDGRTQSVTVAKLGLKYNVHIRHGPRLDDPPPSTPSDTPPNW